MTSRLQTNGADDGDTPTRFGEHGSHERQARSYMRKRVARLKRLARACIREDEKDCPKSPRSLMPATAIARRLPAADEGSFWDALRESIRAGAFDPSPADKAPLRVFNDGPPLRMTSDLLITLTADDGIDGIGADKSIFDEGYLKKTWARIETWSRWCPTARFQIPESWRRMMEAQGQLDDDPRELPAARHDVPNDQAQEPRKVTLVREAIKRLGLRESAEPVKAYQARISADIAETTNETISPRRLEEAERLLRSPNRSKKAKKGKKALPSIASERG